MDQRIIRLQVQNGPVKIGRAPLRRYEPAAIVPVASIKAGPRGVHGITADGEQILDVHHQDHPQSRDRKGKAGILFMGTGDYVALRERYGEHLVDGIAGETVLLDAPDGLAGRRLPNTVTVNNGGGAAGAARRPARRSLCRVQPVLPAAGGVTGGGRRGAQGLDRPRRWRPRLPVHRRGEGTISLGDVVTI